MVRGAVVDRATVVRGVVAGGCAWLCAALVTLATVAVAVSGPLVAAAPTWKVTCWYLHAAHAGRIVERAVGPGVTGERTYDLLGTTAGPVALLVAIPPLSVLVVAFLLARWQGAETTRSGGLVGATLALGYPLGALAAAGVSGHVVGDPVVAVAYRPQLSARSLAVAVASPLAVGAVGGAVAGWLRGRR